MPLDFSSADAYVKRIMQEKIIPLPLENDIKMLIEVMMLHAFISGQLEVRKSVNKDLRKQIRSLSNEGETIH